MGTLEIKTDVTYKAANLISYRGTHPPAEAHKKLSELKKYARSNGARQDGDVITIMYPSKSNKSASQIYMGVSAGQVKASDVEVFVPLDKEIPSSDEFAFVPSIDLKGCITVIYEGSPYSMALAYAALFDTANDMGREVKLPIYNIVMLESSQANPNDLKVGVYAELV
jgi:effector-binding domain-containing protein